MGAREMRCLVAHCIFSPINELRLFATYGYIKQQLMSISLPGHSFPYWSDPAENQSPPALIIGAGFSTPQVQLPVQLATHFARKQKEIEDALKISTEFAFNLDHSGGAKPDDLYCWAGRCVEELITVLGMTKEAAKRSFINAIGLLEDQAFAATANIPLRGTTPRHRVLARLAREGCVYSLWSLNWDLWLEAAFEAVGLVRRNSASPNYSDELPTGWKKFYRVLLPSDRTGESKDCISLYKPHGCIRSFATQLDSTFKITKAELDEDVPADVKQILHRQIAAKPVCAIGWGATEVNLLRVFEECADAEQLQSGELTVVSLSWNDNEETTDSRHSKLAESFGQVETNTLCSVRRSRPGTTDDLMQWIQALRTLRRFKNVVKGLAPTNTTLQNLIEQQIEEFTTPVFFESPSGWVLSWFDTFVPIWSRVCFSSKALVFRRDGAVPVAALPMIRRDEHIPLNDGTADRWDLLSAVHLYSVMLSIDSAMQRQLDFETFPGAFWHEPTRSLLVPIPMWCDVGDISLAAIKPLMESRHWTAMGRVKRVCLLQVNVSVTAPVNEPDRLDAWKRGFCSLMKSGAFARAEKIEHLDAVHLQTYLQEKKDVL